MRVASLVPSATEMVAAMGLGHRLVARTHECDYPPEVKSLPAVTADLLAPGMSPSAIDEAVAAAVHDAHTIYSLDVDELANTAPDVVLTQATCAVCAVDVATVEAAVCSMPQGAAVVSIDPMTLDEVLDGAATIGSAIGGTREGLALRSHLRHRLEWLGRALEGRPRPRTAIVEWPDPIYAPGHWVPDIVERAGATNVFGISGTKSVRSDIAQLAAQRPDVVVLAFCGFDLPTTIRHGETLTSSDDWAPVAALDPALLAMDGSGYTSRPGPRLVDAVEALAWALHRPHPDLRPRPGVLARNVAGNWVDAALI